MSLNIFYGLKTLSQRAVERLMKFDRILTLEMINALQYFDLRKAYFLIRLTILTLNLNHLTFIYFKRNVPFIGSS